MKLAFNIQAVTITQRVLLHILLKQILLEELQNPDPCAIETERNFISNII